MIEKRQFSKTKPSCKVTFTLKSEAEHVVILGDFNAWNETSNPMKRTKDGIFAVTIELEIGREHQDLFLADGNTWLNDETADKYVISSLGSTNSVVVL